MLMVLRAVGLEDISGNLDLFKKERACLRSEQPSLPLVTHLLDLCVCHLFHFELNVEHQLLGSIEAVMGCLLKCCRVWVWCGVPATVPTSLNGPDLSASLLG